MRRLTKQYPKNAGEYRYLRCLTLEHNLKRLNRHVERLQHKHHDEPCSRLARLKRTWSGRSRRPVASIAA